ncbi:MAG: TetR/AcrR family transcriptional regulator [Pseudomonadota bacterium]
METVAAQLSEKELIILDCAFDLLKETGDTGMTMRKIAECAGMRLSNVQYYFKSRDDVLKTMATRYFDACTQEVMEVTRINPVSTVRARANLLIRSGLAHGDHLSDMCRIFRELWAISSRNETIRDHMAEYYRNFTSLIADFILGQTAGPKVRDQIGTLLVPFFEGYSVTAQSTPLSTQQTADMLTDITMLIVEKDL